MDADRVAADETMVGTDEIHLPRPSVWPMVVAAGISLLCAGIALVLVISLIGALVLALGLSGWIQEISRGH